MDRRYKIKETEPGSRVAEFAESLAKRGGGTAQQIRGANAWMQGSGLEPWNPGQEIILPGGFDSIDGEYPGK